MAFLLLTKRTVPFSSRLSITSLFGYLDVGFDLHIGALEDNMGIDEIS